MTTERCSNCSASLDVDRTTCPFCRAPRDSAALARVETTWEGGVADGLARIMTDALLAKDAAAEALLTGAELDVAGPLAPSELLAASALLAAQADPSLEEVEGLLAKDAPEVALEGIQLSSLVDRGTDETKILKRGLTFLKHRRYADALEWWTLQREALDPARRRFELLLLLMQAFTHSLAGELDAAAKTRKRIREHPVFRELAPRLAR
jgi:hypothetical protein